MTIANTQTDKQAIAMRTATMCGYYRDYAIHLGGTGHLRHEPTTKEANRLKAKRRAAKAARKANR